MTLFAQVPGIETAQQATEIARAVAKENWTFAGILALVILGIVAVFVVLIWRLGPLLVDAFQRYLDGQNKILESRIAMADVATKKAEEATKKAEEQGKLEADRLARQLEAERTFRDTTLVNLTDKVEKGLQTAADSQRATAEAVTKAVDRLEEGLRKSRHQ